MPNGSVCKASQADRETPADPSEQDKQEQLEKLGLSPPYSQRPFSFISHLCFPDVGPCNEQVGRISNCPDFLLRIPPELLLRDGRRSRISCATKGFPFVVWLYNLLNTEDCVSHKHHGRAYGVTLNGQAGPKGLCALSNASSASGTECSTVTKGLHLHAFGPSARQATGWPFTQPQSLSQQSAQIPGDSLKPLKPLGGGPHTCGSSFTNPGTKCFRHQELQEAWWTVSGD